MLAHRELTVREIALGMGLSERSVQLKAKKDRWPCLYKKVKGGHRQVYMLSLLPEEIRTVMSRSALRTNDPAVAAGVFRGRELRAEAEQAALAQQLAQESGLAAMERLPDKRQKEADAKLEILRTRDAFISAAEKTKKKGTQLFIREYQSGAIKLPEWVEQALPKRSGKVRLSWASLYRWEIAYEEEGPVGLAGKYISNKTTHIPEHMQKMITGLFVEFPHASIPHVRQAIEARFDGQAIPSASAVRRFVNKWKKDNKGLLRFNENPDKWKSEHMVAFGDASEAIERLNQLWEFDSTPGDVMLADGRHTIIGVIDIFSRRAKMLISPTSRAESVAALTRRAILDWGVPETARTDNGADYVSRHMVRVFESLGIYQELCPPFTPEAKPHIERFFRTFSAGIVELLPGYIGHNVADRKAIEARKSFAQRLMKRDSDPVEIKMTAEEFQNLCDRWCAAMYHQSSHQGLKGKTPAEVARNWTGRVRRIRDERALDILLMPAPTGGGMREVRKKGIAVDGAYHIAPELGAHVGERVQVLLDRTDYGTIYVFAEDGEFICKAVNPLRTGHDRNEIAAKAKAVQRRVMSEGRKELKKVAREAGVREINKEILSYRERQIAQIHELPPPNETYTTPALEEAARAAESAYKDNADPIPHPITEEEAVTANEVISLAQKRPAMPGNEMDCYQMLAAERDAGEPLTTNEEKWLEEFDAYLLTGKRTGLLAAGFQPFAERNRMESPSIAEIGG